MSRRRPKVNPNFPSPAERALEELCVKLGYCLPPDQQETIVSNPPINADAFVDAVLAAEGRDPAYISEEERRPMIQIVTRFVYGDGAHR